MEIVAIVFTPRDNQTTELPVAQLRTADDTSDNGEPEFMQIRSGVNGLPTPFSRSKCTDDKFGSAFSLQTSPTFPRTPATGETSRPGQRGKCYPATARARERAVTFGSLFICSATDFVIT